MTTLLAFIVAIAVLVSIHEYGHYWVARRCGVKVLRFSVGFGKVIYSHKFSGSDTEWVISAIPLGGYVKMLDEREGEVKSEELHLAFNRQPVLKRMAIVLAGPLANLLLAIVLYWALFVHGVPGVKPVLGEIVPESPAMAAQLQPLETIVSVNGSPTQSWADVQWALLNLALQQGRVEVAGRTIDGSLQVHQLDMSRILPSDLDGNFMQKLGLQLPEKLPAIFGEIINGGAAQRAGLQSGDIVKSINGRGVSEWNDVVEQISSHPGELVQLDLIRNGKQLSISLTPERVEQGGKNIGKINAGNYLAITVNYSAFPALNHALDKTWETCTLSLKMIGRMILGQVSIKNLSGPVTIANFAGQSAQIGLGAYIGFLAFISISLGVLNLLPIPLLDGGHLMYYTVELIKGSPVPESLWELGQKAGLALLLTLMALALFNDFSCLFLK